MTSALLLVDIQKDFASDGTLPVPDAEAIIPAIDRLVHEPFTVIVASKDWHPANHCSFVSQHNNKEVGEEVIVAGLPQKLWPEHCVQDTPGADFIAGWDSDKVDKVIRKGKDPDVDSYSAFFDNARRHATGLEEYLKEYSVQELIIAGLATDVCVRATALDALSLGFTTYVVREGCRGLDAAENAFSEIQKAGGHVCDMAAVHSLVNPER